MRHGDRMWKLRALRGEVKMTFRFSKSGDIIPVRLFFRNDCGYFLDITMYKEVADEKTGQVMWIDKNSISNVNADLL